MGTNYFFDQQHQQDQVCLPDNSFFGCLLLRRGTLAEESGCAPSSYSLRNTYPEESTHCMHKIPEKE